MGSVVDRVGEDIGGVDGFAVESERSAPPVSFDLGGPAAKTVGVVIKLADDGRKVFDRLRITGPSLHRRLAAQLQVVDGQHGMK
jgi:hypothetical protein